jgi:SAM-dependent methyltransferase
MIESKPWQWERNTEDRWREPSEESYYFVARWRRLGFGCILDLGCGVGRHALFFAENGFTVDAFDLAEDGLAELGQALAGRDLPVRIRLGDMQRLPYPDVAFDGIYAYHAIYHTDTQGIKAVFAEMERVVRPGGEILLTLNSKNNPSFRNPKHRRIDANTLVKRDGPEAGIPHYYADAEAIRALAAPFKIIGLRQVEDIREEGSSIHYFVHLKK